MKKTLLLVLLFSASLFVGKAWAVPIQIVGVNNPIDNTAIWDDGGLLSTTISIENTSNFDARITAFGFDANFIDLSGSGQLVLLTVSGTQNNGGWEIASNTNVGGAGGGSFDFGVTTANSGNLLGGSPNSGIAVGSTGVFNFDALFFGMTNQFVRFQRTGADGEGSDRGNACVVDCGPTEVPEPSSLLLLGAGLIGAGAVRRRMKRA